MPSNYLHKCGICVFGRRSPDLGINGVFCRRTHSSSELYQINLLVQKRPLKMIGQTAFSFAGICFISTILATSTLQHVHCRNVPSDQGSNVKGPKRVLITQFDAPQAAIDLLKSKSSVTVVNFTTTIEDVLKILPEYDAILGRMTINAKVLDAAGDRLKVISTPSVGFDHLDIPEIKKRGIRVGNSPKTSSAAVAEIAVFLLLSAARNAHDTRVELEKGENTRGPWHQLQWKVGHDFRNKTVGIVGLGNIGQEIAKRLIPFGIKKIVYSGHSKKRAGDQLGAEFVSFDSLLEVSDFVVCSAPLTSETENMFNDKAFQKMKESAVFVNIGRGKTVDTDALVRALKNKTIFAAGLDVTEPEPLPVDHDLYKLSNVVITPHMGSQTVETITDIVLDAAQNILNVFDGKPMVSEI